MGLLAILFSGFASLFSLIAGLTKEIPGSASSNRVIRRMAYLDRRSLLLEADESEFPGLAWALCDVRTLIRQDAKAWQLPENRVFVRQWFEDDVIEQQVFSDEPWQHFTPEIIVAIKADLARTSFPN